MPDYTPDIIQLDHAGTDVTVFGDVHTAEALEYTRDRIAAEMAAHEAFAWEARGYQPDTWVTDVDEAVHDGLIAVNEGLRELDVNGFAAYTAAVDAMALDHFDAAWGPDSYHAFPYAAGLAGPVLLAGTAGYAAANAADDIALRAAVREDLRDLSRMVRGREHAWGAREDSLSLDRRELLTATGGAVAGGLLGWIGDAFDAAADAPDYGTYTDVRDVFTAEGADRIVESAGPDSLLVLVGRDHAGGIARYLADPAERTARLDRYGPVLEAALESDTRMARWRDADGRWMLDGVVDLYPRPDGF